MDRKAYFQELAAKLSHAGYGTRLLEGDVLSVTMDDRQLCVITGAGSTRYSLADVVGLKRERACVEVSALAEDTAEYMGLVDGAPWLRATGLEENYKLLSEFNGAILAAKPTRFGMEFVTWERDYGGTGVTWGHYFGGDYRGAKRDFAQRGGLVREAELFSPEQLMTIFRCCEFARDMDVADTGGEACLMNEVMRQVQQILPDVRERLERQQTETQSCQEEQTM